jgi:hypothetical protein
MIEMTDFKKMVQDQLRLGGSVEGWRVNETIIYGEPQPPQPIPNMPGEIGYSSRITRGFARGEQAQWQYEFEHFLWRTGKPLE